MSDVNTIADTVRNVLTSSGLLARGDLAQHLTIALTNREVAIREAAMKLLGHVNFSENDCHVINSRFADAGMARAPIDLPERGQVVTQESAQYLPEKSIIAADDFFPIVKIDGKWCRPQDPSDGSPLVSYALEWNSTWRPILLRVGPNWS